jgi:hypothetical protein
VRVTVVWAWDVDTAAESIAAKIRFLIVPRLLEGNVFIWLFVPWAK